MRGEIDPATLEALGDTRKPRVSFVQHMIALFVLAGMFWLAFGRGSPFAGESHTGSTGKLAVPRPTVAASSPAISDTLWQLGLVEHIVGRSPYCTHVPATVPVIGDLRDFDAERLLLAKPDVLFVQPPLAGVDPALRALCADSGIRLIEHRLDSFEETRSLINSIADVFATAPRVDADGLAGRLANAQMLFEQLPQYKSAEDGGTQPRAGMPRVLVLVATDPFLAVGRNNYLDELLAAEGLENAIDRSGWIEIAPEGIASLACDAVLGVVENERGVARFEATMRALPWGGVPPAMAAEPLPQLLTPSLMALMDRAKLRQLYERARQSTEAVPSAGAPIAAPGETRSESNP
jgi:ABC-type hemin transport system substrate-binding protein